MTLFFNKQFILIGMLSCGAVSYGADTPKELSGDSIQLQELFVAGRRLNDDKLQIPQYVKTMDAARIDEMNPQTTADLLAGDGMLTVQKSQQGGGSPSIRGFESSRVLLVVDGVRMNNLIYRGGHLQNVITIDPSIIGEAEVIYGPASVGYGSDALGGVISFRTKMPRLAERREECCSRAVPFRVSAAPMTNLRGTPTSISAAGR